MQEDYTNQHTLEQRLQNVAKRMVSRHPAQQGRQPHPALLGLQHGQGTNQPALASTASNGFLNQLGLSSNVQQQNHPNSFSLGGRSLAQSSPQLNMQGNGFASPNLHPEGGLGLGNHGAPHHSSGSNGFMNPSLPAGGNQQVPGGLPGSLRGPGQQAGGGMVGGSPSVHLPPAGLQPKLEPGAAGLPGMGQFSGMPEASTGVPFPKAQAPTPSASPGPIMSNGAPVLLGRSRNTDWAGNQISNSAQVGSHASSSCNFVIC